MIKNKNITSPLRAGFSYQDLWGIKLIGDWLLDPTKYKWIQFEASSSVDKFYLDDIVCYRTDNLYSFYQIKHKQDPENGWTWGDFLRHKKKGTSIFKKWSYSLQNREIYEASFISNGKAAEEINLYLINEKIDIEKIRKDNANLYQNLLVEIGDDQQIKKFFELMRFKFNQKNLFNEDLEQEIKDCFFNKLKVTKSGILNLIHEIKNECQKIITRQLDLETIKQWCEYDNPRLLDEFFVIPSDFQFFNKKTHEFILSSIQKPEGGMHVIFGNPGVGKSVYLAKLAQDLSEKDILVIKHHYYLSPEDLNPQERVNTERIIEAIKAQFKNTRQLGSLANENSKDIHLRDFITEVANNLKGQKKTLAIIVDGLDHAIRYSSSDELKEFLQNICFPQTNVWFIFGTQEIDISLLHPIILEKCPKQKWIEIKGLNKLAFINLLRKNDIALQLPEDQEQFNIFSEKLYEISQGNPLHLRYSLQKLKNLLGNSLVTEEDCSNLIPYSEHIERYYTTLWNQIPLFSKTILLSIASVNFCFTKNQIFEYASSFIGDPNKILMAFNNISHLISTDRQNRIKIYHISFDIFLKTTQEFEIQKKSIKSKIKSWLQNSNYEYLKWAELSIIENELGNSQSLLQVNREWLIESICFPRNSFQVSNQLNLAAKASIEKKDLYRYLQISHLNIYYQNTQKYNEDITTKIWIESIYQNTNSLEYIDLRSLPAMVLLNIANIAYSNGKFFIIDEIINLLEEKLPTQSFYENQVPMITATLLKIIPFDFQHDLIKIYEYILKYRQLKVSHSLFEIYTEKLLELNQNDKVIQLLNLNLLDSERISISEKYTRFLFKNKENYIPTEIDIKTNPSLITLFYLSLNEKISLPNLPEMNLFLEKIDYYSLEIRAKWTNIYFESFVIGFIYGLSEKSDEIEGWINNAASTLPKELASCFLRGGTKVSLRIKNNNELEYKNLFDSLIYYKHFPEDDQGIQSYKDAFEDAKFFILELFISLKEYLGKYTKICLEDYYRSNNYQFIKKYNLIKLSLSLNKAILSNELYQKIVKDEFDELKINVFPFNDRSEQYWQLSKLARLHSDNETAQLALKQSVNNLLGYGNHKDMYLSDVLDAVELCTHAGTKKSKIQDWIYRLSPLIDKVIDYTDKDHTRYFLLDLANFLATHDKDLLNKIYYCYANKEDYYRAENLFKYLLKSLSFKNGTEIALATTALNKDAFLELRSISESNPEAKKALDQINSYLGEIHYPIEKDKDFEHTPEIDKIEINYDEIHPNSILSYSNEHLNDKWKRQIFLEYWFRNWIEKTSKSEIYACYKQLIQNFGESCISRELLNQLYPVIYQCDASESFNLLCRAQRENYGWERYWTEEKKSIERWSFLKNKFPNRYEEFFKKTTMTYVPLLKGVKFMLFFQNNEAAEIITESSVRFIESLMADLIIPKPDWLDNINEIQHIDILLQRLVWPSPLIQERSATAIANLLCSNEFKVIVFKKLLLWIKSQKIETTTAIGLLPIIKAFYTTEDIRNLSYLSYEDILNSIPINSEVIKNLLLEISYLMKIENVPTFPGFKKIELFPIDWTPDPFFSKYINTALPKLYMDKAREIEKNYYRDFTLQWFFTTDEIIKELEIKLSSDTFIFLSRSGEDEFLLGFSSKISEAYRSAFIRVLQHLHINNNIHSDFYYEYVYATLPIDITKWNIKTNCIPKWWPSIVNHPKKEENCELKSIEFNNTIESLIQPIEKMKILAAEGAILESLTDLSYNYSLSSFELIAFGYEVLGPKIPNATEISRRLFNYRPMIVIQPSQAQKPFQFLLNNKIFRPLRDEISEINDLLVQPLVLNERQLTLSSWQYFRSAGRAFNINPILSKNLIIHINEKNWELRDNHGKIFVIHKDWLGGLKERFSPKHPLPYGQYLMVDEIFLNRWLAENNLRLGYLIRINYRFKKSPYDKINEYQDLKLLQVSNLII